MISLLTCLVFLPRDIDKDKLEFILDKSEIFYSFGSSRQNQLFFNIIINVLSYFLQCKIPKDFFPAAYFNPTKKGAFRLLDDQEKM